MSVRTQVCDKGIARRLIETSEAKAVEQHRPNFMLETAPTQPGALMLHGRMGYKYRGAFGDHPDYPLAVFMQKSQTKVSRLD